jgi:metal-responsive CopG/Arc/MetJ family transcriptional regulator
MSVEKFSISLPRDVVADLDEIASAEGLTRSSLIREMAAEYVSARRSAAHDAARRTRIESAIEGFESVASSWGDDSLSAAQLLAEVRGDRAEAPGADG